MKKKRNFLVQFALQSKYNFFACVVALLVLLFSVSSVTYAWIEGANAFTINSSGSETVNATGDYFRAANVTSASSATSTLNLSNYIDPKNLYLAPAKGEISGNDINVQIKEGSDYRDADINDISNNYIFFEVKVHAEDIITDYVFQNSSIKIGENTASDIRVGVTVLDKDRNALGSKITTAEQVAVDNTVATDIDNFTGFQKDTDYILQFKIWTEGTENYSDSTVNFRLNLVPEKGVSTITFQDVTNSNTSEYLLSGKVLYAEYGNEKKKFTAYASHMYTFSDIPDTQLENVTISAYDSETAKNPVASWTPGYTKDKKAYAAYGNIIDSTSSGTFDVTHVITLIDSSVENLLNADKNAVKLYNGTNTYAMYNNGGSTKYTVHLPASEFVDKNVVFSSNSYYAETSALTEAINTYHYHILGETQTTSTDTTTNQEFKLCAGYLFTQEQTSLPTIEIRDLTSDKSVVNNAPNVYASYSSITTPYKASYIANSNGTWQLTALPNTYSESNWSFSAYPDSSATSSYTWDGSTRKLDNEYKTTFYFLKAVENGTYDNDGTWTEQETSNCPQEILKETKVSFYAGIQTSWNQKTMVLSDLDNTNTKYSAALSNKSILIKDTSTAERNYYYSPFTLESKKYHMWFNSDNLGLQMSEKAQGGKFYGLWSVTENDNYTCVAAATTAATKIAGVSSASSSSPASIALASGNVDFTTNLSSITSIAKTDLWLEYFAVNGTTINTTGYEIIGKINHADLKANTDITKQFDLSAYTASAGNVFQVVTVLTDGDVYYVADRDYLKVVDTSAYKSVTVSTVANATVTATYTDENGVSKTIAAGSPANVAPGTKITVTVNPDSGYELDAFSITGATATTSGNTATFTMGSSDVTISATITKSADRVIYLYDAKGTFTTTPSIWYWTAGGTSYAEKDGYSYNDNKATMSLVSGYSNVYQFTLKGDSINAQNFIFYSNASVETSNSDTSTKNMYNTSTGNWETFPPTVTTIASGYYLMGKLPGTDWENGVEMYYPSSSSKNAEATVNVTSTGTYEFKFKNGSTWYGCNTTITNTCTNYTFYSNENSNCKFTATSTGTYKFSFNTDTKNLTVTKVS